MRYARAFGADLAVVMVKGPLPDENRRVAKAIEAELSRRPSVKRAASGVDLSRPSDPMLAFRRADARGRRRLVEALTPEGMRARLRESRALLLAPGGGEIAATLTLDPLRLWQLAFEGASMGAGMRTQADGAFANDDGTMHLVLVQPVGQSLRGADARAFHRDAMAVIDPIARAHPSVTVGLTGGHAIAAATEAMLTRDLTLSGSLSMVLASAVFVLIFRRARALVAVMPPLVLGTLWTAGLAAVLPGGLSAIAVAFTSVVVGVGVDTGVHVYSALLDARRRGLSPDDAARDARRKTTRAVLIAAFTAAAAFAALALSEIHAVCQLGILCAAGEVLTAVAIVAITPEVGALLERGTPPPEAPSRWTHAIAWLTATRGRALIIAVIALAPIPILFHVGPPELAEALVGVRPQKLAPLAVQREILEAFGGKRGQVIAMLSDRDPERARERGDAVCEGLVGLTGDVESVDAITTMLPALATERAREAERDALDLPAKARELERALVDTGFAPARFAPAIEAMRHPMHAVAAPAEVEQSRASILLARYLGEDQGDHLVALYIQPSLAPGAVDRIRDTLARLDSGAALTGYGRLDASLRAALRRDLPRIGAVACVLVVLALALSLRRLRDVVLAALVVGAEIALVLLLIRALGIPLHAYAALVLPVLLGITVDEGMFLLHHARGVKGEGDAVRETLRHEGPPVAATALTTAAGFLALGICDFDGLRDLGWVGGLGSVVGLLLALTLVPAGLRLTGVRREKEASRPEGDCSFPRSDPFRRP